MYEYLKGSGEDFSKKSKRGKMYSYLKKCRDAVILNTNSNISEYYGLRSTIWIALWLLCQGFVGNGRASRRKGKRWGIDGFSFCQKRKAVHFLHKK
jgi:hypothetical protein